MRRKAAGLGEVAAETQVQCTFLCTACGGPSVYRTCVLPSSPSLARAARSRFRVCSTTACLSNSSCLRGDRCQASVVLRHRQAMERVTQAGHSNS